MTSSESKGSEPSATMITTSKSELPTTMESTFTTKPDSENKETSNDVTSKATQQPDTEHIVFTAKTTTVSSAQAQLHQEEPEDVSITDTAEPVISNAAVTEPTTITTTDTLPKFTTISETSTTAGPSETSEPLTASESKGSEPSTTMITTSKSELPTTMESTFTTEPDSESKETSKTMM